MEGGSLQIKHILFGIGSPSNEGGGHFDVHPNVQQAFANGKFIKFFSE